MVPPTRPVESTARRPPFPPGVSDLAPFVAQRLVPRLALILCLVFPVCPPGGRYRRIGARQRHRSRRGGHIAHPLVS